MALNCRIELDKEKGITLTVENKDGKITQTAHFDGQAITLTSKGESDTSTLEQKPDCITVKCKTFKVEAETITFVSEKDTGLEAKGKFSLTSTEKATLSCQADLEVSAASDLKMSAANLKATADSEARIGGATAKLEGSQNATVSGGQVKLEGQSNASLSGSAVSVKAQSSLNLEGAMATLKGSSTNIQGSLIKLG